MIAAGAVSLPMYDWPELQEASDRFWALLREPMMARGLVPPQELDRETASRDLWRSEFLFSQTCGYPYITALIDHVSILGVPVYAVEGCGEGTYRSAIIVRTDCEIDTVHDAHDLRFAFNSLDSLSGYRCLSPLVGDPSAFFAQQTPTAGHRASADFVAQDGADIAAIDAICWHHYQRVEPERAARLKVIGWTPEFPALPFITAIGRDEEEKRLLRDALFETAAAGLDNPVLKPLRLAGVVAPDAAAYGALAWL